MSRRRRTSVGIPQAKQIDKPKEHLEIQVENELEVVPQNKSLKSRRGQSSKSSTKRERVMKKPHERLRRVEQTIIDQEAIQELKDIDNYDDIQDEINILDIQDGIIITKDDRFLKILEIEPTNFILKPEEAKANIITMYEEIFSHPSVSNVQIKATTRVANSERYMDILRERINAEDNPATRKLASEYATFIKSMSEQGALTRRFFVIIEYSSSGLNQEDQKFTERLSNLYMLAQNIAGKFQKCENPVTNMVNTGDDEEDIWDEEQYLLETLYEWYNPRTSMNEPLSYRTKIALVKLCEELGIDRKTTKLHQMPKIPIDALVAPKNLNYDDPNCVLRDGMYYGYLFIKSDGYPKNIRAGWAYHLISQFGEGVDIDIFAQKGNRKSRIESISGRIPMYGAIKMNSQKKISKQREQSEQIVDANMLLTELQEGFQYYEMFTLMTISALTKKDLKKKIRLIKNELQTSQIHTVQANFDMPAFFEASQFLNQIDPAIFEMGKQNISSIGLAALSYLFYAFELGDDNGVLLGLNAENASMCVLDLFNTKRYKNANMVIIGTSGAGKTFTAMLLMLRMRILGVHCFVLAPLKGHEFKRSCDAIGGTFIQLSPSSSHKINPLEIRDPGISDDAILDAFENGGEVDDYGFSESLLARKMEQLKIFFSLLIEENTEEEKSFLDTAVYQAYQKKGIGNDNSTLFKDPRNRMAGMKEMPILEDVYNELGNLEQKGQNTKRLRNVLVPYVHGANKMFNGQTNVDLKNKYTVLDISKLADKALPVGMFICLDYCWEIVKQDRTRRKAIFIDETWKLINSNPLAANFVLEIFKIIRGYYGSAIAATQDLSDFYALEDGKYGRGIINNSKTKIILNLEADEVDAIRDIVRLTPLEAMKIEKFDRGEAFLYSNNTKIQVLVKASKKEIRLITTDGAQLKRQVDEKRRKIENRNKVIEDIVPE